MQENELTKRHLMVAQNASGRSLNVPIYHFKGRQPGPKVYIQSSIHGSEVQGNVVIYHLIQMLSQLPIAGEVTLVPNCNPVGTNIKAGEYTLGRFDPVNGTNWNRGYYYSDDDVDHFVDGIKSDLSTHHIKQKFKQFIADKIEEKLSQPWGLGLAQQLNLKLQAIASQSDLVIDLHNGPVACRHLYIPEYAQDALSYFNIPHTIVIPNHFAGALDEATFCPWWRLADKLHERDNTAHSFEVEGVTVEFGSQEIIDFDEGKIDSNNILNYLAHRGVLPGKVGQPNAMERYKVPLSRYKTLFTRKGGMVDYRVKPGEHVKKGQVMAKVLNIDELDNDRGVEEILAPCDLIAILHFPSASVLSGTQLYKCFTLPEQVS